MRLLPAVLALAVVAASCGPEPDPGPRPQAPGTVLLEGEAATDRGSVDVAEGQDVELEAGDFYFEPTVWLGGPGATALVRITNATQTQHNITLSDLGIDEEIGPGQTVEVELTFPSSGTTVFFCSYHRDRGMLGALVAA